MDDKGCGDVDRVWLARGRAIVAIFRRKQWVGIAIGGSKHKSHAGELLKGMSRRHERKRENMRGDCEGGGGGGWRERVSGRARDLGR
jgi:hypothetical protein